MNVQKQIERVLQSGISIETNSEEEEDNYRQQLLEFLIKKNSFCLMNEEAKAITVSSHYHDIAEIVVVAGSVFITPLSDEGFFKVFMDMLEFIAKKGAEQLALEKIEKEKKYEIKDEDLEWL